MSTSINDSIWKTLLTTIIPLCLGTLIFGMMLESYKNELNFRGDIMKDYYSPLVGKQRECFEIGDSLAKDYNSMAGNYVVMMNQYKLMLKGQSPRLTNEYKEYLVGLLKNAGDFSGNADEHRNSLSKCRDELHQTYINVALVTGTLENFKGIDDDSKIILEGIDRKGFEAKRKLNESIKDINLIEVINTYFIAGDAGDKRNGENDKYTDELIASKVQPLIEFFSFIATLENEKNQSYLTLSNKYNAILESEISSRYKRNWFSRTFF